MAQETRRTSNDFEVAVIGMACRFPGADTVESFWENLRNGVESITFLTDGELLESGVGAQALRHPAYVKAAGVLPDVERFDSRFFGFSARQTQLLDPQHRLFLEMAWVALERAGYAPDRYRGSVGVFGGSSVSAHYWKLLTHPFLRESVSGSQALLSTDRDFLATRVAYKLNLRGPAVTIQTACSTSLAAVHLACQSLLAGECDIALAGGVSASVPQKVGYLHEPEGILSRDGHCRAFDAEASGTVKGNGVGVVVLKRLADALRDRDCIDSVVKGWAMNNDGANRVGFTAPGVEGQARVVRLAHAMAEVEPDSIGYVEAHGTGTALGDPIEIAALSQVMSVPDRKGFCAIGSVKTNVGHLDAAAGVAGLIKAVLMLKHRELVPSLHFRTPNPRIDFANSPFYVSTRTAEWHANGRPRRAAVSSLGMGGTNIHVVLEEPPAAPTKDPTLGPAVLALSARTEAALEQATDNLADHLEGHPELDLGDVAFTLLEGRQRFLHRRAVVCRDLEGGARLLRSRDPKRTCTGVAPDGGRPVVFLFTGQGAQYVNMGRGLYEAEAVFRSEVDACCERLQPLLDLDLRELLYPDSASVAGAAERLNETRFTQPALFTIEYALARLWRSWGVQPQAMIGHSVGEYVAACLAGVMTRDDALSLVAERSRLMQACSRGAMLAVALSEEAVGPLLSGSLELSVVNAPDACVVGGRIEEVDRLEGRLRERNVAHQRIPTSHAFHCRLMDNALEPFAARAAGVPLETPRIPFVSNVTGTWITPEEATDPAYWTRHLARTVRFSDGLGTLLEDPQRVFLEVGPGLTLTTLVKGRLDPGSGGLALASVRHARDEEEDGVFVRRAAARLWTAGVAMDGAAGGGRESARRVVLPTYPFEHESYGLEARTAGDSTAASRKSLADWFYLPSWKRSRPLPGRELPKEAEGPWLVFADDCGLGTRLARRLADRGQDVVAVTPGEDYRRGDGGPYQIDPAVPAHYEALIDDLCAEGRTPRRVLHLWGVTPRGRAESLERSQELGFLSLVYLVQSLSNHGVDRLGMAIVTSQMQEVSGEGLSHPEKATVLGPCRVVPREYPGIVCRSIDVVVPQFGDWSEEQEERLLAECAATAAEPVVALRGIDRWVQTFEPVQLEREADPPLGLLRGGVYLVTGGLGGIGLELADYLARSVQARLVLVGRSGLPPREEWDAVLRLDSDSPTSRRIRKVRSLESQGAEVAIERADVTRAAEMEEVFRRTEKRFGRIDGVVHAAGTAPHGVIQLKTREAAEAVMAAKVTGSLVLCELLRDRSPHFLVLCSSLASVMGQPGQVDYSAANAFLDALARRNTAGGGPYTVSINWDTWAEVGMSGGTGADRILPREGAEAFGRIVGQRLPQILTSVIDLAPRLSRSDTAEPPTAAKLARAGSDESSSAGVWHPRPAQATPYAEPSTDVERTLAEVWQDLLGIDRIGVDDNFFELGGDSLTALQAIGLLKARLGRDVRIVTFYEAPTVRLLAGVLADRTPDRPMALEGVERGDTRLEHIQRRRSRGAEAASSRPVPLTPIQQWFFELQLADPHHFNQSVLLEVRQSFDPALLERAVGEVVRKHDALGLRYVARHGRVVAEPATVPAPALVRVDLSDIAEAEQARALEAAASEFQRSLDPVEGRLVKAVYFDRGRGRSPRLLLVVHHLAVDALSWQVLLGDLETACGQLAAGLPLRLPSGTASFADWARALADYSRSDAVGREAGYWLGRPWDRVLPLPVDREAGDNTAESVRVVSAALDARHTQALLGGSPRRLGATVNEILLTALAVAVRRWTEGSALLVDLEAHGREAVVEGVEISRTVGWFTSLVPVLLALDPGSGPVEALRSAKEQFRAIPGRGFGYGLLRYLRGDEGLSRRLAALPQSEMSFLYLGRLDHAGGGGLFGAAPEPAGEVRSPRGHRRHLLEVTASVTGGQLRVIWMYSEQLHHRSTVEAVAEGYLDALRSLVVASAEPEVPVTSGAPAARWVPGELPGGLAKVTRKGERDTP